VRYVPLLSSAIVLITGMVVLVGWRWDVEVLKSIVPGLSTMKANTASAFVLAGTSLSLLTRRSPWPIGLAVAQGLGLAVAATGGLTLAEYLTGLNFGIDELLFVDDAVSPGVPPGRMGMNTATAFVCEGCALILMGHRGRRSRDAAQVFALAGATIAAMSLVGYAYSVRSFYGLGSYTQMAVHTATAFVCLGIGIAAVAPYQGVVGVITSAGPGGVLARRLLPIVVLGPFALGWLRLEGQRAGWYGTEFGVAILASASAFVFAIVVLVHAIGVDRAEAARLIAEGAQRESQRLAEASRLKSEFLANMSHELRTPLNAVIGFADLMYKGKVGAPSSEHKEYLGDILTSARHLLELINEVLDLAKVESGTMTLHPELVDSAALVGEVTHTLRGLADAKRLQVAIDIDRAVTTIVVDPARVKQILYNYLSNAIKFTADGGRIQIRLDPVGPVLVRIAVEDTGIGIAAEQLSRLFVEFHQLDAGIAKQHQGTGLGLALTRRLAEAQGGWVSVESTAGVGSTFSVVIPRVAAGKHSRKDAPPGSDSEWS
jgi:signal transduction histidine kinase